MTTSLQKARHSNKYSDVVCINTLKSGNLHAVVIYMRSGVDSSVYNAKILFDKPDSMPLLIQHFHGLYRELGMRPPAATCPAYESDLLAQHFEIRFKEYKDKEYILPVYGVDSMVTGPFIVYYPSGKKRLERNLKNGWVDGPQRNYHGNGKLAFEGDYVDGLAQGRHSYYYENGKKSMERNFENGAEHGVSVTYWENGLINTRSTFDKGILVMEEAFFEDGTPQGPPILFR